MKNICASLFLLFFALSFTACSSGGGGGSSDSDLVISLSDQELADLCFDFVSIACPPGLDCKIDCCQRTEVADRMRTQCTEPITQGDVKNCATALQANAPDLGEFCDVRGGCMDDIFEGLGAECVPS